MAISCRRLVRGFKFAYPLRTWRKDMALMGFNKREVQAAICDAIRHGIDPTRSDDLYDLGSHIKSFGK